MGGQDFFRMQEKLTPSASLEEAACRIYE